MRAASQHTEALLLRSVDYGESDRVVTLLTAALGKIALIARGARRSRRRFAGALEPFTVIEAEIVPHPASLATLAHAHARRSFPRILGDLARMGAAGAALELVREIVPEREPDPTVFLTVVAMLEALDAPAADALVLLTLFHARLVALAGFAPLLDACGTCGKRPREDQSAAFDPRGGGLVCRGCGGGPHRLGAETRRKLARALGPDWVAVASEPWPRKVVEAAYRAMHAFLEHRLGRELRSPTLLFG